MDSIIFRVITAVLLVVFIVHRGYYTRKVRHADESVLEQPAPGRVSQIAGVLALLAFLSTAIYLFFPSWISWAALPFPSWLRWLGDGVALAGFALLQWSQQTLGRNWSDAPKLVDSQKLVVDGPYQWIRHPIYASFLLILGSLLFITANWLVGGLWLGMAGLDITSRMKVEEAMMLGRFGEQYQSYMQRTGRLVPRIRRS